MDETNNIGSGSCGGGEYDCGGGQSSRKTCAFTKMSLRYFKFVV